MKTLGGDVDRSGASLGNVTLGDALRINRTFNARNACTDPPTVEGDIDTDGVISLGGTLTENRSYNSRSASCN
jgi:hypothetical protein